MGKQQIRDIVVAWLGIAGGAAALVAFALSSNPSFAGGPVGTKVFDLTPGSEKNVAVFLGLGREKFCATAVYAASGQPAPVRWRRTQNGRPKDLDRHVGRRCLTTKAGVYRVYLIADEPGVRVTAEYFDRGTMPRGTGNSTSR